MRARHEAQRIGLELGSMESVLGGWSTRAGLAHPSARTTSVFGPRPVETAPRRAWDAAAREAILARMPRRLDRVMQRPKERDSRAFRER